MIANINSSGTPRGVLKMAHKAWLAAADMRSRRSRYKRYTYGDQWSDIVKNASGEYVTEEEYAVESGKRPLTNNLIRQLVKSIVGYFRTNETSTDLLQHDAKSLTQLRQANCLGELDARMLEEFLISGCAIQRVTREARPGKGYGVWVDNVSPSRFFIDLTNDPRGWDARLVGMIHDMSLTEVIMRYAHGSRLRSQQLTRLYNQVDRSVAYAHVDDLGVSNELGVDFFRAPSGKCRVIEVWTLEGRERLRCHDRETGRYYASKVDDEPLLNDENALRMETHRPLIDYRWDIETCWHCRFFAPDGTVIEEMDSPYEHGSHPFVAKFYPLTDGEIHSFVEDVIDQQRYVNRLITLIDHVMGSSAKGVLLFPDDVKADWMSWDDVARNWSKPDGVIPVKGYQSAEMPRQMSANNSDIGAYQLLDLELRLMEDISGVSRAFMGREAGSTTAASLYNAQAQNSAVAMADIYATFNSFRGDRDAKMLRSGVG